MILSALAHGRFLAHLALPVSPSPGSSSLLVADFNRDGRLDLAISQNGAETKLYENLRAKRGLIVQLVGRPGNPAAIGARIRIRYAGNRYGPAREVQAGSGYWSMNSPVQVMGLDGVPDAVWVRWPGGKETNTIVRGSDRNVRIRGPL